MLLEEIILLFCVKVYSDPEVDSASTCDEPSHGGGGGECFCLFFGGVFRTPSGWTSSARLVATFFGALDGQQLLANEGSLPQFM